MSQDSEASRTSFDAVVEQTNKKKGDDSQGSSPRKDEGLGESFEQSELANGLNGIKNVAYDAVPEESISEAGSVSETQPSSEALDSKDEITLDPAKLPYQPENVDTGLNERDASDVGSETGSLSKKVSFYGGAEVGIDEDPVSDTYVYKGKPKTRFRRKRVKWKIDSIFCI